MKAVTLKMLLEVDQFIYTQHSLAPLLGSNSSIQTHNLCTWMIWQSGNLLYWNKMHLYVYVSMWRGFNVDRHFFSGLVCKHWFYEENLSDYLPQVTRLCCLTDHSMLPVSRPIDKTPREKTLQIWQLPSLKGCNNWKTSYIQKWDWNSFSFWDQRLPDPWDLIVSS